MIAAAVQFYDVVLWLHVTSVVVAFGPTFAYPAFFAVAGKSGPEAVAAVGRAVRAWDRDAGTIGALVILATGIYLVIDRWGFGDFFVSWGIVAILLIVGATHAFMLPRTAKVVALLENGQEAEAEVASRQVGKAGAALGVLIILTIYVMTAKPFL